jgi:Zn-dependent protease/CBS domain-containing protein
MIAGVPVHFSWDLLVLLALPIVGAYVGGRPYGEHGAGALWALVATAVGLAFVFSVGAHELAHAVVAQRLGLPVRGVRLSLLGGAAEFAAERSTPADECLVALAGLVVSFALGIVAGAGTLLSHGRSGPLFAFCIAVTIINGLLTVLNVLPSFPLDGGRIVRAAAWYLADDLVTGTRVAASYGQIVSWVVLALGMVIAFYSPIFGLWTILVGYSVGRSGRRSFVQLLWQETSQQIPLAAVTGPGPLIAPERLIGDIVDIFLEDRLSGPRPVGRDGEVLGMLDLETNVRHVPRPLWMETTVADAMTPVANLPRLTLTPEVMLSEGVALLERAGVRTVLVVDETDRVIGLVTRERVDRWVRARLRESGIRFRRQPF